MAGTKNLLAFDLGAESGRGIVGRFDGERLQLNIVHRFPNGPVRLLDALHWDVLHLYGEMLNGLRRSQEFGRLDSVGVDTWGVDFGLLDMFGGLLSNPRHYRDPHTEGVMEMAFERLPRAEIFRQTGLQFMRFNTLFQLLAMARDRSPLFSVAKRLLLMPDLFHFFLSGEMANEVTNASTSQMYDPTTRDWARPLLKSFGLPTAFLGKIVPPGTVLGPLSKTVATEVGIAPVPVVVPATHDTAAAVAAVPARGDSWCYISSGTWSLMGAELPGPLINDAVAKDNFTNEVGVGHTSRFLKNIMGLWLVQECRRAWDRDGTTLTYEALAQLAKAAPPFLSLIDPDEPGFILPTHMPQTIAEFCRRTKQPEPTEPGAVVRCCLESLALRYRWVLERLEALLNRRLEVIHIVGGGCQNKLLCQLTADACDRPVVAGPVEATAAGNVLTQALGLGLIGSLAEAREVVRRSFDVVTYEPRQPSDWDEPYQRFLGLLKRPI